MPDYNIYIHTIGATSGGETPTKPIINVEGDGTTPTGFDNFMSGVSKAQQFATGGLGSFVNTGVALLAKAFPYVAIAILAANMTDKVISTGFGHLESYTGNYEYSMGYNNFKTIVGNALNPVNAWAKESHRQAEFRKQNMKVEQERALLGRSFINKVGV